MLTTIGVLPMETPGNSSQESPVGVEGAELELVPKK